MKKIILALSMFMITGCGKHEIKNFGFTNSTKTQGGEVAITPADFMKLAIEQGDQKAFQKLLDGGIDVNVELAEGRTPLIQSTISGNTLFVHLLLAKGADATLRDADGKSAADYAAELQRNRIGLLLDPQKQSTLQQQLMKVISDDGDDVSTQVGDLLTAGVDPNFVDSAAGETPLTAAITMKSLSTTEIINWQDDLAITTTNINLANTAGKKPLSVALALPQNNKIVKKIVSALKALNAEE